MTNVLIVEDEQAIRRFLRTALEGDRMRVFEAETLQRGLLEAATRKPDLIILDLGLPDGDGIEFIRDLRQWSAVPVIVLSARSEESDKIAALDAGADDYLSVFIWYWRIAGPSARRSTPPLRQRCARSAGEIFRCYRRFSRPRDPSR